MGGTIALRELIGLDRAKELAMTAKVISGTKAHEIGLVTHVDVNPVDKAVDLAKLICQQSPDSIAATKKLYNKSWWSKPGLALARESYYQIKILFGKNRVTKTYNQTHPDNLDKEFSKRQRW
jgi:enoyl-CoA hydratase/carnithine racemase